MGLGHRDKDGVNRGAEAAETFSEEAVGVKFFRQRIVSALDFPLVRGRRNPQQFVEIERFELSAQHPYPTLLFFREVDIDLFEIRGRGQR